jgi:zinc protease
MTVPPSIRALLCVCLMVCGLAATPADAQKVQEVTSPGGVKAWLVQSPASSTVTLRIAFKGGALQEPDDKPGVASLMAYSFNEGAGDMDAATFLARRDRIGASIGAEGAPQAIVVNFSSVTVYRDEAFALLEKAFAAPRYDADMLTISKAAFRNTYETSTRDPAATMGQKFQRLLYGTHKLAYDPAAHIAALDTITPDDLKAVRKRLMTRANMYVSAVGDIDAATLSAWLDRIAAHLPPGEAFAAEKRPEPIAPRHEHIDMDLPQTLVMFGHTLPQLTVRERRVVNVLDTIMNGGMTSRLFMDVREKRGLVYGINANYSYTRLSDAYIGVFGSAPDKAATALSTTYATLRAMAENGPTEDELAAYKTAAEGRHVLGIESNEDLANWMVNAFMRELPANYIETYVAELAGITAGEVQALAKKLLRPEAFTVISVGRPNPPLVVR